MKNAPLENRQINPKSIYLLLSYILGSPGGASGKESTCQCRIHKRCRFNPWVRKIPWKRVWQPTPVFLPGESHGHWSLVGCSPGLQRVLHDQKRETQHAHTPKKKPSIHLGFSPLSHFSTHHQVLLVLLVKLILNQPSIPQFHPRFCSLWVC